MRYQHFFYLLVYFFCSPLTLVAQQPIPTGTEQKTASDHLASRVEYYGRDVTLYDATSKASETTPAAVAKFIHEAVQEQIYDLPKETTKKLASRGRELVKQFPQHPILALRAGNLLATVGDVAKGHALLTEAYRQLKPMKGLHRAKLECIRSLAVLESRFGTTQNSRKWTMLIDDELISLCEADLEPTHQRHLYVWIESRYKALRLVGKSELVERIWKSDAHEWIKHTFKGQFHNDKAWHERGGGYAYTVSDKGWKLFEENMKLAAKYWQKAWELDKSIPTVAGKMISLAVSGAVEGDTPREWFDRAVSAQMDYPPAYDAYVTTLMPRWGGSHKEMFKFAEECLATKRFDTAAGLYYVKAIFAIAGDEGGYGSTLDKPKVFDQFAEVLEKAAADESRQTPLRYGPTSMQIKSMLLYCGISWQKDKLKARMAKEIGRNYDATFVNSCNYPFISERQFDEYLALPERLRHQIATMTPSTKHTFDEYLEKWKELADFTEVEATTTTNWRTKRYLEQVGREANIKRRFRLGEWVPLELHQRYDDWMFSGGEWDTKDGALIGRLAQGHAGLRAWSSIAFHPGLEMEVVVRPLESFGNENRVGILIGYLNHIYPTKEDTVHQPNGRLFWVDPQRQRAGVDFCSKCALVYRIAKAEEYTIRVKAWPRYYAMYVNGKLTSHSSLPTFRPDGYIGLGSLSYTRGNAHTKFSNLRVRKLPYDRPPSDDATNQEKIAYYQQVIDSDQEHSSEKSWGTIGLFDTLKQAGEYEDAVSLVEQTAADRDIYDLDEALLNNFTWMLATCPDKRIRDAQRAMTIIENTKDRGIFNSVQGLDTAAATYAANGQFAKAIELSHQAIELAGDRSSAVGPMFRRLRLYEKEKPFLETPKAKK